jgi:hypothetical protein
MLMTKRSERLAVWLLASNLLVWAVVRYTFFAGLTGSELRQTNLTLAQVLLLFDTLIVVWWYTEAAWHQVDEASKQVNIGTKQVEIALSLRREANKPIVVTTREGENEFYLQNIGPGLAINCFIVVPVGAHEPNIHEEGALAADGSSFNSLSLEHLRMNPGGPPSNHLVIAEALYTRTQQWIVTLNVLRGEQVLHKMGEFKLQQARTSLRQFLDNHYDKLVEQLRSFETEVEQNP